MKRKVKIGKKGKVKQEVNKRRTGGKQEVNRSEAGQ